MNDVPSAEVIAPSGLPVPDAEDLSTIRLRLYHVSWLNHQRIDYQLAPLMREIERGSNEDASKAGLLFKASFRGGVALIKHFIGIDIREHPSVLLLMLIKFMDDSTIERLFSDYKPLITWVNDPTQDAATNTNTTQQTDTHTKRQFKEVQLDSRSIGPHANGRDEWDW